MVSGLMGSDGEGDLSRLVMMDACELPQGDRRPEMGVLCALTFCSVVVVVLPATAVVLPVPVLPSTGMPLSERNSSRSTYCGDRKKRGKFNRM